MIAVTELDDVGRSLKRWPLTPREREVVALLAQGITSRRQIADQLVVSERTVKFHMANILWKLDCTNSTQVVIYALTHGRVVDGAWEPLERDSRPGPS